MQSETGATGRRGADELRSDLERQLALMGERVPAYRRILAELIEISADPSSEPMARFERAWQHRHFDAYYERPLLILACLRQDASLEGESHPLWGAIATDRPDDSIVTRERVLDALSSERLGMWTSLRTRRVQTNEVTRAVTWLWPAALAGAREGRPLLVVDIGASAGLNLIADQLDLLWRDQVGQPIPVARRARVLRRLGFDLRPLDAKSDDDVQWLRACLWPGERARMTAMNAALQAFATVDPAVEMIALSASAVPKRLSQLLGDLDQSVLLIAYQTLMASYLTAKEREVYVAGMNDLLAGAPRGSAVWSTLEVEDETDPEAAARLTVSVATGSGVERLVLAKTGYHPVTLTVDRSSVQRFIDVVSRR